MYINFTRRSERESTGRLDRPRGLNIETSSNYYYYYYYLSTKI